MLPAPPLPKSCRNAMGFGCCFGHMPWATTVGRNCYTTDAPAPEKGGMQWAFRPLFCPGQ
eukprot:6508361-Lingulodinium_polyedra.AAC.1